MASISNDVLVKRFNSIKNVDSGSNPVSKTIREDKFGLDNSKHAVHAREFGARKPFYLMFDKDGKFLG